MDQLDLVKALYFQQNYDEPFMIHMNSDERALQHQPLQKESVDLILDKWNSKGFGVAHIFTLEGRLNKVLRDLDF
jgi:hypothetical protein